MAKRCIGKKMRFQLTLEGAECLGCSDAGWQFELSDMSLFMQ